MTKNNEDIKLEKKLTKSDVVKSFIRWSFISHTNYNYERLQASMFTSSLKPVFKRLYGDDPDGMKEALQRHMAFFNTEPHFGGVIHGIVIAMEEQKANGAPITGEAINSIKTGLMGPLAGGGDTLWQGTIVPILLAIGISLGIEGNLLGPLIYILLLTSIMWTIAYNVWMKGYELGTEGIQKILSGNLIQSVIMSASILGAIVLGALGASFVNLSSPIVITIGQFQMPLQSGIIDPILKGLLPLTAIFLSYYLMKVKRMKSLHVMGILFVGAFILGDLGILG